MNESFFFFFFFKGSILKLNLKGEKQKESKSRTDIVSIALNID